MAKSFWDGVKFFFWQIRGITIATPTVAGLVILLRLSGVLQNWEWRTYDLYLRLRPPEPPDSRIAIVGIDEKDVTELNESIISDAILAQFLHKLKAHNPRVIGLDIYRNLPVSPGEAELQKVFETTPNLIGIQKVAGQVGTETVDAPPILKEKRRVGANDFPIDADSRIRRGLFYLSDGEENVYSFALMLAGLYLYQEGISPQVIPGTDNWQFGKATFVPFEPNDGGYVRADAGGFQVLINYRGNHAFEVVPFRDVLNDRLPPNWGQDRLILVGKVGESFKDLFFTPYSDSMGLAKTVPGVEIHAHLASQIISAALGERHLIQTLPDIWENLWILLWSGIGSVIAWQFRYKEGRKKALILEWGLVILGGATLFLSTYSAMLVGWWIPVIPPFLALLGSAVAITAYIARSATEIRKTFGRYLTDEVVANLLENPTGLCLGGERRKITILTSDLRGFTATAEGLPPEKVISILNFYLGEMAEIITKYNGTIDEFMGDGILVLFGAPTSRPDDVKRAVACAIEMQLAMTKVNDQMEQLGFAPLQMGIGINTGEVVVGNIGSEKRTKYGIVGNQVNLTYRIESYTTGGQILISQSSFDEVASILQTNGFKEVQPKGIKEPIRIYDVVGIREPYQLYLVKEEEVFYSLEEAIPLQYFILEGKHISETGYLGTLTKLSATGGEIYCQGNDSIKPEGLTNIKINLLLPELTEGGDIYAKVLDRESSPNHFWVYFTAKPPHLDAYFRQLYNQVMGE